MWHYSKHNKQTYGIFMLPVGNTPVLFTLQLKWWVCESGRVRYVTSLSLFPLLSSCAVATWSFTDRTKLSFEVKHSPTRAKRQSLRAVFSSQISTTSLTAMLRRWIVHFRRQVLLTPSSPDDIRQILSTVPAFGEVEILSNECSGWWNNHTRFLCE